MLKKELVVPSLIILFYLVTHLFRLGYLPVFADESIYIRWSQLILDDWSRYLFFALNDGKTPLFIWLMVPFQPLFTDQLWAARVVAVLVGAVQVGLIGYLLRLLGAKPKAVWLGMIFTTVLPFWFFQHRMALIDGLLTLWLTVLTIGLTRLNQLAIHTKLKITPTLVSWVVITGLALGAALWTKVPAILFVPTMALFSFWSAKLTAKTWVRLVLLIGLSGFIGLATFGLLRLSPAFGQLFSRGSDFLYSWRAVFIEGLWQTTIQNWPTYVSYFLAYLTTPVMILVLVGLFTPPHRRTNHILFWSAIGFLLPIAVLGRVVYPRYLFPASLFFTVIATLTFQDLAHRFVTNQKDMVKKMITSLVMVALLGNTLATSGVFMVYAWINPNQLPFVEADRAQYLTEWSSGHGITETAALISETAQRQSLAVATEGYFGTLPDGLLLYFHGENVDNLYIEGVGQPVVNLPSSFVDRAREYERVWLVVNSHRLGMALSPDQLLASYCRPFAAPCLQIWDITSQVKNQ